MKQNETDIEHHIEPVPYTVHESALARDDMKNKRLWITLNAIIAAIIAYGVITYEKSKRNVNGI